MYDVTKQLEYYICFFKLNPPKSRYFIHNEHSSILKRGWNPSSSSLVKISSKKTSPGGWETDKSKNISRDWVGVNSKIVALIATNKLVSIATALTICFSHASNSKYYVMVAYTPVAVGWVMINCSVLVSVTSNILFAPRVYKCYQLPSNVMIACHL